MRGFKNLWNRLPMKEVFVFLSIWVVEYVSSGDKTGVRL